MARIHTHESAQETSRLLGALLNWLSAYGTLAIFGAMIAFAGASIEAYFEIKSDVRNVDTIIDQHARDIVVTAERLDRIAAQLSELSGDVKAARAVLDRIDRRDANP